MTKTANNSNIVIEVPKLVDVPGFIEVLQGIYDLATQTDHLLEWNPDIARQVKDCKLSENGSRLDGLDISRFGIALVCHSISQGGASSIQSGSWHAAAFCIMEGCGFCILNDLGHFKYYSIAKPNEIGPPSVIASTLRLLSTRDENGFLHPEKIIVCVDDNRRDYAVDYLIEANAAEVGAAIKSRRFPDSFPARP